MDVTQQDSDSARRLTAPDRAYMKRAIALALRAESQGSLPIGALIVLDERVVAEGMNAVLSPQLHPGRHAERTALAAVPVELWPHAGRMTCYSTLEPCVMCTGTLLVHGIGRVVYGAADPAGGGRYLLDHLPAIFQTSAPSRWEGPVMPERCQPLFERAFALFQRHFGPPARATPAQASAPLDDRA